MSNSVQILDKIERNMKQRGYEANITRVDADTLTIDDGAQAMTVTYDPQAAFPATSPMRGVSDASSPFLGIGNAGPGSLRLTDTAVAQDAMFDSNTKMALFAEAAGFANDIVLESSAGDFRIAGQSDVLGLGE